MRDELFLAGMVIFLSIVVGFSYDKSNKLRDELNVKRAQYDSVVKYCAYKDSLIVDMATKMNYDGVK